MKQLHSCKPNFRTQVLRENQCPTLSVTGWEKCETWHELVPGAFPWKGNALLTELSSHSHIFYPWLWPCLHCDIIKFRLIFSFIFTMGLSTFQSWANILFKMAVLAELRKNLKMSLTLQVWIDMLKMNAGKAPNAKLYVRTSK